jgi:L-alanine-DL-glutamate epimerase-like enolase superfamily enzyme
VWDSCVIQAASLAFAAATPGVFLMEHCMSHNPLLSELAANPLPVVDGVVTPRDEPGLGVELDDAFIARHRVC